MLTLTVEGSLTSFSDVMDMCKLANKIECQVRCMILGKEVIVAPNQDPHEVYRRYFQREETRCDSK